MQLNIESTKTNPSGKSMVIKAGGKDYLAKVGSGLQPGMVIEAETKISEYNGKTNTWIEKWKAVAGATPTPPAGTSGHTNGGTPPWLPFASNTVAHAINGGLITNPDQVKQWAAAAKQSYEELVK